MKHPIIFVILTSLVISMTVVPAVSKDTNIRNASKAAWMSGEISQGLRQDSKGNLIASTYALPMDKPLPELFAAAYYQDSGVLITIDKNAVTSLYEKTGRYLKLKQTRPPHKFKSSAHKDSNIHPVSARFCNVPGLVYLTWSYPEPSMPIQTATRFTERLALGSHARNWYAVTTRDDKVKFLAYTYRIVSAKTVHLFMPDGKKIIVRLPGALAESMDSLPRPYVNLEPVFVIPDRAIICKTRNGWSVNSMNGSLISYISCKSRGNWGWCEPFYHNGHFYAAQTCKGIWYYRMDTSTGKLVYVGQHFPG